MTRPRISRAVATALAVASVVVPVTVASAAATQQVNLGAALSPEMLLPVLVAQQNRCFATSGMDFRFLPLGGPQTRDALAGGQINFALFHVAPIWIADERGLQFKFVSMYYTKEIFGMLASSKLTPKVTAVSGLKGLRGLTATPGSASYAATVFFLKRYNLNPSSDVQLTFVGSTDPTIWLNALETQKVQFLGGVWEPVYTAAINKKIGVPLFDPANAEQSNKMYGGDVSTLGLVTTAAVIKSAPQLVKKVVSCVDAGLSAIPKASDDQLVEAMRANGVFKLDQADLKAVIRRIRGNYQRDGRPSKENYDRAVKAYLEAGYLKKAVPYSEVVDPNFAGESAQ